MDAITGLRYVIIFVGAYGVTKLRPCWLRENFSGLALVGKTAATLLVAAGLVLLGLKNGGEGGISSTHVRFLFGASHHHCSSATPPATRIAADHRRNLTSSFSTYLARSVSSK